VLKKLLENKLTYKFCRSRYFNF